MPKVSVLMPLYNGRTFIEESLNSVQAQTFTDWEFIIVNDFGSDDGCANVVKEYSLKDSRIKLVQANKRLGLADSLNLGLDMCSGEYIARVDVDDPSLPERLEKEVAFMDLNRDVVVCSCFQNSLTPNGSSVLRTAYKREDLKAAMMFGCEVSHCGVMFRKSDFDSHNWRYDSSFLGEDYELWTRIISEGGIIEIIPEPLVTHRWGFENISITKGERLRKESSLISKRIVRRLGVNVDDYNDMLFRGWRSRPEKYAKENIGVFLKEGHELLSEILTKNQEKYEYNENSLRRILWERWDWIRESCCLKFSKDIFNENSIEHCGEEPLISVVLPSFNSVKSISCAIDSIIAQSVKNWELLVINDFGSDDGTADIVEMYALFDSRIKLITPEKKLGLARSLNLGINTAKGKYVARLDSDDTSMPNRFERQIALMEECSDVGVCGSWQRHYGGKAEWIHKAESKEELLKAELIFWCNICHSTVMLRKSMFVENKLEYNPISKAEDFELWSRAIGVMRIVNIPEILGDYNESGGITGDKFKSIYNESGKITAIILRRYLNVFVPDDKVHLLNTWDNKQYKGSYREKMLADLENIFREIYSQNRKVKFYDDKALLQTLAKFWHWVRDDMDWVKYSYRLAGIDDVFKTGKLLILKRKYHNFLKNQPDTKSRFKRIKEIVIGNTIGLERTNKSNAELVKLIDNRIKWWTWERYTRISTYESSLNEMKRGMADVCFEQRRLSVKGDEKIRIVFLFQVASFWTSWDSFFRACDDDIRIEAKLLFLDETNTEKSQMKTAKDFLEKHKIDYINFEEFDIDSFKPHVIVIQTPYDNEHRIAAHRSVEWKKQGYRIVYIPYGIEISDTPQSRKMHFEQDVVCNAWRIYTFNDLIMQDYRKYCVNGGNVRSLGLPKLDFLSRKDIFELDNEIVEKAKNRPILLWKVHFPKSFVNEDGKEVLYTPYMDEYLKFAEYLKEMNTIFCIFMPHPKFCESFGPKLEEAHHNALALYDYMNNLDNAYVDVSDDYRPSLYNADFIIMDRSAVMIEAIMTGVPCLYMENSDNKEPLTKGITPIIDSIEHGTESMDMISFLQRCLNENDNKKDERLEIIRKTYPYLDGNSGQRIKEDILLSIFNESELATEANSILINDIEKQIEELKNRVEEREQELFTLSSNMLANIDKRQEWWTWERFVRTRELFDKNTNNLHRQIDYSTRDILVALDNSLHFTDTSPSIILRSECRLAEDSIDHIYPRGTANDDTRYPRFIKKCEDIISQKEKLAFLDLGCSGGGMVLDAVLRGHTAIGLEGSDYSEIRQRAEWRLLRKHLFTCNIVRPFDLMYEDGSNVKFDIITAWDVMEHIQENDLTMLMDNVKKHLSDDGIFVASIALYDDIDEETGVNWHVTVKSENWWKCFFEKVGFTEKNGLFDVEDMARGGINNPIPYHKEHLTTKPYYFAVFEKA